MNFLKSLLSLTLIVSITALPFAPLTAHAKNKDDFHAVCDGALKGSKDSGDQLRGECTKAQMADNARKVEKTKTIVFGSAAVICTAMAVIENLPWSAAAAKAACMLLSAGASASGMLFDSQGNAKNKELVGGFAGSVNSAMSGFGSMTAPLLYKGLGSLAASAAKNVAVDTSQQWVEASTAVFAKTGDSAQAVQAGNDAAKATTQKAGDQAAKKAACFGSAISLGLMAGIATTGWVTSNNTLGKLTTAAKDIKVASTGTSSYNFSPKRPGAPNNNPNAPNNNPAAEFSCDQKSGNEHLACISKISPELSKLVNSPGFVNGMNTALGKNLGDFAKGFDGETQQDAAKYIANGLGLDSGIVSNIMNAQQKLAKGLGAEGEAYKPGAFASANNGGAGHKGGVDPMEKMLADMMKQMGDMGEDGLGKDRDPASEISFNNQMELLQPDQIAARTDISLFDRAHYRMQKNIKNLEQLNWSSRDTR